MPAAGLTSFAAWLDAEHVSPHTRRAYLRWVGEYLDWLPDLTPAGDPLAAHRAATWAARDWRMHLLVDRKLSPASVDQAIGAVAAFYRSLGLPRPDVKGAGGPLAPTPPKALTTEQVVALLRGAETRGPRDHALVHVGLHGLRIGELCALDTTDLAWDAGALTVTVRYGKGGQPRQVPLEPGAAGVVRRWLGVRRPRGDGPLWVTDSGRRLSVRAARHAITTAGAAGGVRVHPHMLRHTFLTRLARAGWDEALLADLAGHRTTATVRAYTRSAGQDRRAAVADLTVTY
jgi:integrase